MDRGSTLLAFIAGVVAGAAAALLMAPDSGEKTRERIRNKAEGVADYAKSKILERLDALEKALEEN
jgi:gas vesicle protein